MIKFAVLALAPIALPQAASGVVIVNFFETETGVIVSFNGTLAIDPSLATDTDPELYPIESFAQFGVTVGGYTAPDSILGRDGLGFQNQGMGTVNLSPLGFSGTVRPIHGGNKGVFGFNSDSLSWGPEHISDGEVGAVSELTFSMANAKFVRPGATLASLGAGGIAEGTVLWTANTTDDTIIFSGVPEPSSVSLLALCGLSLLSRKRS